MSDHDALCPRHESGRDPVWGFGAAGECQCDQIARVRADERERIAQEIEAERDAVSLRIEMEQMCFPMDHEQVDAWASERVGLNRAARIARGQS